MCPAAALASGFAAPAGPVVCPVAALASGFAAPGFGVSTGMGRSIAWTLREASIRASDIRRCASSSSSVASNVGGGPVSTLMSNGSGKARRLPAPLLLAASPALA